MATLGRVVCAGLLTVDLVHVVDRVPGRNEKIVDDGQTLEVGGPAANAARTAAALGCDVVLLAGFGESPVSEFVAAQLAGEGVHWVDLAAGQRHPAPFSTVLVDRATGERSVVSGGAAPATGDPTRVLDAMRAHRPVAVLIDGHGGAVPGVVASGARELGVPVILDGGSFKAGMDGYLHEVDLALLSADFAAPGAADSLTWAIGAGAAAAARSAGGGPIVLREAGVLPETGVDGGGDRVIDVASVPVVDTLGAGDVLHGAALAALAACGGDATRWPAILAAAGRIASTSVAYAGALGWTADPAALALARSACDLGPG